VPDFKAMRRLPASSVFRRSTIGKQRLRIEFRYQVIIAYRVVEAFEPLVCDSLNISCFETISADISAPWIGDGYDPRPDFSDPSFCGQ